MSTDRPLVFLHVGDLHLTQMAAPPAAPTPPALVERENRLEADVAAIFAEVASIHDESGVAKPDGAFDFVYLPGDLAENAGRAEYEALAGMLIGHEEKFAVRLIPGDHDRARGTMTEFRRFRQSLKERHKQEGIQRDQCLEVPLAPGTHAPSPSLSYTTRDQFFYECEYGDVVCLFLDMVSAGDGQKGKGLDFRLGAGQTEWLKKKVGAAKRAGTRCCVFMHCYPADMHERDQAADLAGLIWDGGVSLVEMGHTHYNEIAHDGRTQYATARSVGQNEDGPVGYAVVTLDKDVTSWRFKQLQQTWPFVMITCPADRRLATKPLEIQNGMVVVRALVLSDQEPYWNGQVPDPKDKCERGDDEPSEQEKIVRYRVWCSVDSGEWLDMQHLYGGVFELAVPWREGSKTISVNATDGRWKSRMQDFIDMDSIEPAPSDETFNYRGKPDGLGSGALQVGAWQRRGLRGDQLGPNNGGRKW